MKKQILTIVIIAISCISLGQVEPSNKYLFSYGLKFNEWNRSYFGGRIFYFNEVDSDNYNLYVEAQNILGKYGKGFGDYDLDTSESDGEIDPIDVIYEKVPFRSEAKVERIYTLGNEYVMKVFISEKISYISLKKK